VIITAERLLVLCVERRLEALDNNDDDVRSELNETRRHVDALIQQVRDDVTRLPAQVSHQQCRP